MNRTSPLAAVKAALRAYPDANSPVTNLLLGLVVLVFSMEVALTSMLPPTTIRTVATGLFGVYPLIAWPFAPVLHSGIPHVSATVLGLVVVGIPVEQHWSRLRYAAFLLLTGYATIGVGAGVLWLFSGQQVAFYGTSGVIYALAGFALTNFPRHGDALTPIETAAILIGGIAALLVLIDPLTGPYFAPRWINGGHTTGLLLGLLTGWTERGNSHTRIPDSPDSK